MSNDIVIITKNDSNSKSLPTNINATNIKSTTVSYKYNKSNKKKNQKKNRTTSNSTPTINATPLSYSKTSTPRDFGRANTPKVNYNIYVTLFLQDINVYIYFRGLHLLNFICVQIVNYVT